VLGAISYDPIVRIELGPVSVSPHGIGIAVGFLVGAWFMLPRSRAKGIPDDLVYPLFTRAAIGAIIGARVAYVLNHFTEYESLDEALRIWEGGISLMGGMIGAILLAMPKIKSSGLSFWKVMDAASPGLALGIVVGRIGDLVVADHLGKTTDFFLGYRCPPLGVETASPCAPTELAARTPGAVVHQTALYDMLMAAVLLGLILWLARKPRFDGFNLLVFGAGYGTARIIEDFLREDLRRFGLTGSQWTAATTIALCLFTLFVLRRTPRWGRWDEPRPHTPVDEERVDEESAEGEPVARAGAPTLDADPAPQSPQASQASQASQKDHDPPEG
jgi:phosphatidylglycerol:prolipoprotein diacylglycerol transferase